MLMIMWQRLELVSELKSDLGVTVDWDRKLPVGFNAGKTQVVSFYWSGAIDVKMDGSVIEEKSSFEMLGLSFASKLNWGSYIVSITKSASKKIGALILSLKFLFSGFDVYLYKSTIRPYIEYCCHAWACGPSCYFLVMMDKLQKLVCRTVGSSLAALLNPWL